MRIIKTTGCWIVLVLAISTLTQAGAQDLLPPQMAVKIASERLKAKLEDKEFIRDFALVNAFVDDSITPHVDFRRIASLVLGKYWRTATGAQKDEFTKEFKALLVRSYSQVFFGFRDWSVRFLPLKIAQDSRKIVMRTEILQPNKPIVAIDYQMLKAKNKWLAYNIKIEGVSLVNNWRTSAYRIGSASKVIARIKKINTTALAKRQNL